MDRHLRIIVLLFFSLAGYIYGVDSYRVRGTNTHYQQGDWTTFASTRFVRHIALDDRYVYFATTGGITRYNFFSYIWESPWTVSNGLADNNIFLVAYDFNTGYLWCVSEYSISYLEPAPQLWRNQYFDEIGFLRDEYITSIGFGTDRRIYIETNRDKLYSSDHTRSDFFPSLNQTDIQWFGKKAAQMVELPLMNISDGYLLDFNGRYIDDLHLRHFEITCSVSDKWNNIWVGTWGLGACRGNLRTNQLELLQCGLWEDAVQSIAYEDETFWLGSVQGEEQKSAITEWRVQGEKPQYYEAALLAGFDNGDVSSIVIDNMTVWFGTRDGLTRFDRNKNIWRTLTVVDNLIDNQINDILVDQDYVWIATAAGVSRVLKSTVGTDSLMIQHVQYSSLRNIKVFDMDFQYNLLWMATEFGIFVYDWERESGGFYKGMIGPANRRTFAVCCYGDEVWFGSEDGVAAFNSATKEWLPPPAKLYETDAEIYRIVADKDAVWVATGSGVIKYDRHNTRWVRYTQEDGLASDLVYSLFLNGDYIWFGTSRGLTRFYWNSPYRID